MQNGSTIFRDIYRHGSSTTKCKEKRSVGVILAGRVLQRNREREAIPDEGPGGSRGGGGPGRENSRRRGCLLIK